MHAAASYDALAAFDNLRELYAFLLERSGELDVRDRVLAALVELARESDEDVVSALLWLALWPGLCNVYLRRMRRRPDADELISAIALAFTLAVHDLDVARVRRIAATLVRNTERRVADLQRAPREELGHDDVVERASNEADSPERLTEGRLLHAWLTTLLGGDGNLLFAVLAFGDTQPEAAARVGLAPSVAKKRFERALARLRGDATKGVSRAAAACA
jgi:RNA polymerase sigma-70 factor (ECF subfamily)